MIFFHSLGQPLIVRSHSMVHRSRGNPKEITTWASRVSNYSYFPWFNRQQKWRPATGSSLYAKKTFYILYRIFSQSPRVTLLFCGRQTVRSHSNKGDNCIRLRLWCLTPLLKNVSLILWWSVSFGWRNRGTWREQPTCRKSRTNLIT